MKKIEVHVFPGKTTSGKSFRFTPLKAVMVILGVLAAIAGFILFSPMEIAEHVTDKNVVNIHKQNKVIRGGIKEIRKNVDESILLIEETKLLRDSTMTLGGFGYALENAGADDEPVVQERKSLSEIESGLRSLLTKLEEDSVRASMVPILHPLRNRHVMKNRFEMIVDPFTEQLLPHRGIDYIAAEGDTVVAPGAGVVLEVRPHRGFGLSMKIDHMPGIRTFYAHLGKALVQPGAKVRRGEPIALVGESGTESTVGLHYEIRVKGVPVNPEDYFITK